MAISSPGIGSNLDVNSIVSQLMTLEQAPLTAVQKKEADLQAQISALGSLKGTLSSLQTAAAALVPSVSQTALQKFSTFNASVADTTIASASAASNAAAGSYSLEVTSLASAQRLMAPQDAAYTSAASPLANTGTLTLAVGSMASGSFVQTASKTIDLTAAGSTLADLRSAINSAGLGVTATIMTTTDAGGASHAQLMLTSDNPGLGTVMKLSGLAGFDFDPDSATGTLSQDAAAGGQAASNAAFKLNGIATTSTSNTVSNVIDGLTLTLTKQSAAGVPTTLTVTRNTSGINAAVNAFISAYNNANSAMANLGSYDPTTKTAGALNGDSTLRSAQSSLRTALNTIPTALAGASMQTLSQIGISVQKDGSLSLDSTKFANAVSSNLSGVADLLSAYGSAFNSATDYVVGTTGTIATRTDGINASIKSLGQQADTISARLVQIEANYRQQFTALDTLMSSMTQTSNYLTQQLASLPKAGSLLNSN
jgi:flagellar hook-associated protein 2